jgi:transcriptional pleiotropic regulator of transition state genes
MKSTGIVRKVDELGRIVLPIELRRTLNIDIKDAVEIYVDGDTIMLKKYVPGCVFCSNVDKLIDFQGQKVCKDCAAKLAVSAENRAATVNVAIESKADVHNISNAIVQNLRRSGVSL